MARNSRRNFLKGTGLLGALFFTPYLSTVSGVEVPAPSDRLRMGSIGVGPMGFGDAWEFHTKQVDIPMICDLDSEYGIARAMKNEKFGYHNKDGKRLLDTCSDYRRLLDRQDIEAVSIGTPDHWHVKIAIEAMQAGKHVFCQKPLTLTLEENQLIRRAVKQYGKVFQVGTQQRSQRNTFMTATLLVRGGYLGEIKKTTCFINVGRKSGVIPKVPAPTTMDWNIWQGQAPEHDYCWTNDTQYFSASNAGQGRGHLLFRWWFEYSGGRVTDWGAHHIDCALWALGRQKKGMGPIKYIPSGVTFVVPYKDGYAVRDDMFNTPYDFNISCLFEDKTELLITSATEENGILFEGTKGRLFVNRGKITGKLIDEKVHLQLKEEDYLALYHGKKLEAHKTNFIRCIREGGTPVSDVESNVEGMNVCHLANIACRLLRPINWDAQNEKIIGDDQAAAFFARKRRKGFEINM